MRPVQFNPVQKTLRVYSHLRTKLTFDGGADYFIDDAFRSSSFESILGNLLVNADTALSSGSAFDAASDDNNSLLIITHPNFLNAANTLADWKIKKGIHTEVRTTDQTGSTAIAIQQFIRNAYDNWNPPPTYVLLIGDADFIPCHYETSSLTPSQGTIGTDLYYATVDGDDYMPDIHVGRLSVDTSDQANNRVNDIIAYEKNPPTTPDFYIHATVASYFQDDDDDGYADRRYAHTTEEIRNYLVDSGYTYTSTKYVLTYSILPFLISLIMRQSEKGASIHLGVSHIPPVAGTVRKSIA